MAHPAPGPQLPHTPARLASNGRQVLVADRGGTLLFWDWPGQAGPLISAHDDGGPVAAAGADFVTTGGWDPTVTWWDGRQIRPRFTHQLFDGWITALASRAEQVIVAGADRVSPVEGRSGGDRVTLAPGRLIRLGAAGTVSPLPIEARGQIDALAAGPDWVAAIDRAVPDQLHWLQDDRPGQYNLPQGPATALTSAGDGLVVADGAGLWYLDPDSAPPRNLARFSSESPRVLGLVSLGDQIFGRTSLGVLAWPEPRHFTRGQAQPADLAAHGDSLLILWEDGWLEERDPADGLVRHTAAVPHAL